MAEIDERYKRGMIYTIRNYTDDTLIYVGSTINTLSKRFNKHKETCKYCKDKISLYNYIENNDWTDWYIEFYEQYPCNNKKELDRREGQVIREIGTINKNIAGRTKKEYLKEYREQNADKIKEQNKEYYEQNADKIKKYREDNADKIKEQKKEYYEQNADRFKEYREQNADKLKEYRKEYYENNVDKIKEQKKEYRKQNADKIKEKKKEKVCCNICGTFLTKYHLAKHQRTKKCMSKNSNNIGIPTDNHI